MTWDGSKGGIFGEQQRRKKGVGVSFFCLKKKIGKVGGTCNRKPLTLF